MIETIWRLNQGIWNGINLCIFSCNVLNKSFYLLLVPLNAKNKTHI